MQAVNYGCFEAICRQQDKRKYSVCSFFLMYCRYPLFSSVYVTLFIYLSSRILVLHLLGRGSTIYRNPLINDHHICLKLDWPWSTPTFVVLHSKCWVVLHIPSLQSRPKLHLRCNNNRGTTLDVVFFLLALQPPLGVVFYSPLAGFSPLACEVSWSHTTTRHIR